MVRPSIDSAGPTIVESSTLLLGEAHPIASGPMHAAFFEQVRAQPHAIAVVDRHGSVTYAWLARRAIEWATAFREVGLRREEPVGIALPRSPDLIAAMLGAVAAGGCYVPLDPDYPTERIRLMVEDSDLRLVAGTLPGDMAGLHQVAPSGRGRRSTGQQGEAVPVDTIDGDQLAYILYTSGTTGRPKGIELTHRNAVDLLGWCERTFGGDLRRVLASTSISFDCSILEIFGPLTTGGEVLLASGPTDHHLLDDGRGAELAHSVPSVLRELIRHDGGSSLPSS